MLIIVGDIVEKGPKSLETLKYIMSLYEKGNVIVLAGNVDIWQTELIEGITSENAESFFNHILHMRNWKGTCLFDETRGSCNDSTDYMLPVEAGDLLSIVKATSRGYLSKKNGVTGWYCGEVEPI